jgi:hypothetical protein
MMGETLDETGDVGYCHVCAGISSQVEQEVSYDSSLLNLSNKRSL